MADTPSTTNPTTAPSAIEQWLVKKGKECLATVRYAENNADDWAGALPVLARSQLRYDAERFQYAADCIATLVRDLNVARANAHYPQVKLESGATAIIERGAKAIYAEGPRDPRAEFEREPPSVKDHLRREARAALNACGWADLLEAVKALADAADGVGVRFFDTDTLEPEVEAMQRATKFARAVIAKFEGRHG